MSRSPGHTRKAGARLLALAVVVLGVAGAGALVLTRNVGGEPPDPAFSRFSNGGVPLMHLTDGSKRILERVGSVESTRYLGARDGRAFYRILRADAPACYGAGFAEQVGSLGSVSCPSTGFPSVDQPFLDLSLFDVSRAESWPRAVRIEGLAADAVRTVAVFDPDGKRIATAPVVGNVYSTASVEGQPIGSIVGVDRNGRQIVGRDFRRGS